MGNLPQGPAKVLYNGSTNVVLTPYQSVTLSAYTTGDPTDMTYQWWQNGTAIPGANSQSYTIPSAWDTDNGTYCFTATNSLGGQQSPNISVTVYTVLTNLAVAPATYGQMQTLFAGANAHFAITSITGAPPISFQWYVDGNPDYSATGPTYSVNNVQSSGPSTVACVVGNAYSSLTTTWNLTVVPRPTASYPAVVLADQPTGYWRLNEGPDNLSGNNGLVVNDYLNGNTSGNFSIEAWVNGDANQNNSGITAAGIVAKGAWAAEQFTLDTGGANYAYRFTTRDSGGVLRAAGTSTNTPDGKWHHLVGVLDETHSNLCLYVDGIKVATTSCSPSNGVLSSSVPVSIGSRLSNGGTYAQQFFGSIDDVAIYNYALSATQVAAHYQAATTPLEVTLTLQRSGANLILGWPQGTLLAAPTLNGPWTNVPNATPPSYQVSPTSTQLFYRVQVR